MVADAASLLGLPMAVERILARIASLVVPKFASHCTIAVADGPDAARISVEAGRAPSPAAAGNGKTADGRVLTMPMRARGKPVGSVRFSRDTSHLPFSKFDKRIAGELASLAALAVEFADLFERERLIAATLQRALLPASLPTIPGVAFHASYRPAANEAEVGGDWYDAFVLPGGKVAISVGDVAGHGLDAAVAMGEVRHAFRVAAFEVPDPTAVLELANRVLLLSNDPLMVTAIFGTYDPNTRVLTYATAGHPAPVLSTRDEPPQTLPYKGVPLGVTPNLVTQAWSVTLPPGSLLTLYTDGLIECTRDVEAGERRLLEIIATDRLARAGNPAEALMDAVLQNVTHRDDTAILTMRLVDEPLDRLDVSFSTTPVALILIRRMVGRLARSLDIGADRTFMLQVAVGEAVDNAITHAYLGRVGTVRVQAWREGERLQIIVSDEGRWRPARSEGHGRGLMLMRSLMTGVEVELAQSGTVVRMNMNLAVLDD